MGDYYDLLIIDSRNAAANQLFTIKQYINAELWTQYLAIQYKTNF